MTKPKSSKRISQQYVILAGIFIYGPFTSAKEAAKWANNEVPIGWTMRPVTSP